MKRMLVSLVFGFTTIILWFFAAPLLEDTQNIKSYEFKKELLINEKEKNKSFIETLTIYYKDATNDRNI